MNEEGVKQSVVVPVFKKSTAAGAKRGMAGGTSERGTGSRREIEAALLCVDGLSLRQFRRNEYHGRICVNDKLKRGTRRNKSPGRPL